MLALEYFSLMFGLVGCFLWLRLAARVFTGKKRIASYLVLCILLGNALHLSYIILTAR